MSRHVFLVGFMGSGKSTVGRLLADRLGLDFVDMDGRIADVEGRSIPEIFESGGEKAFRRVEHEVLESVVGGPPAVVACGGGIIVSGENTALMREAGYVVYLEMDQADVLERLKHDGSRPLLSEDTGEVVALFEERRPIYEAASDATITTTRRRPEQIAAEAARVVSTA